MINFAAVQEALWTTPVIVFLAIVWKMAVSGSRKSFPLFFSYCVYQIAAWIVLVFVEQFGTKPQHFYAYSAISIVGSALQFAAIYEIFVSVFRSYEALRDFAGVMFRWAGLVLLLVALLQALSTNGNGQSKMMLGLLSGERSVSLIACGLLLFLLLFSKNLGLSWRTPVFGIALGFGLFSAVELGLWTARILFSCPWGPTLSFWRSVNWNVSLLLWAYYVFAPEHKTVEAFAPKLILERWNQVLRSVNRPVPQGAFMPNLEKIVDDVLAHQTQGGTVH